MCLYHPDVPRIRPYGYLSCVLHGSLFLKLATLYCLSFCHRVYVMIFMRNRNRLGKNMVLQVNNIYKTSLKACFCLINMPLFVR